MALALFDVKNMQVYQLQRTLSEEEQRGVVAARGLRASHTPRRRPHCLLRQATSKGKGDSPAHQRGTGCDCVKLSIFSQDSDLFSAHRSNWYFCYFITVLVDCWASTNYTTPSLRCSLRSGL